MKAAIAAGFVLAAGLAGCASVRDRIMRAPPACEDVTVPIYFERDAAEMTADGRRLIAAEAAKARRCRVQAVRVVGLADAPGDPGANLELSQRRAASVAEALRQAGLPPAEFEVAAAGEAQAVTADGALQPVRRRAEVTLKLKRPK